MIVADSSLAKRSSADWRSAQENWTCENCSLFSGGDLKNLWVPLRHSYLQGNIILTLNGSSNCYSPSLLPPTRKWFKFCLISFMHSSRLAAYLRNKFRWLPVHIIVSPTEMVTVIGVFRVPLGVTSASGKTAFMQLIAVCSSWFPPSQL